MNKRLVLIILVLAISYFWTIFSASYIGAARYNASATCINFGCGGVFGLGWVNKLPFLEKIVVFTFGLPGLLFLFVQKLMPFTTNAFLQVFFPLFMLVFPLIAGFISVLFPLAVLRFWHKSLINSRPLEFALGVMLIFITVGGIGYLINSVYSNKTSNYQSPFVNKSAEVRNVVRKSHAEAVASAIQLYREKNGILPPVVSIISKPIAKTGADICQYLVPNFIGALPVDPKTKNGEAYGGSVYDCFTSYDTGLTIRSPNGNQVVIEAPLAENGEKIVITK